MSTRRYKGGRRQPRPENAFGEALRELYALCCARQGWDSARSVSNFETLGLLSNASVQKIFSGERKYLAQDSINQLLDGLHNGGEGVLDEVECAQWRERLHVLRVEVMTEGYLRKQVNQNPALLFDDLLEQFIAGLTEKYRENPALWALDLAGAIELARKILAQGQAAADASGSGGGMVSHSMNGQTPNRTISLPAPSTNTHTGVFPPLLSKGSPAIWRHTVLTGHTFRILDLAWSPDGDLLASGACDGTVRLWRADGSLIAILKGHLGGSLASVAWSPDGSTLAAWPLESPAPQRDMVPTGKGVGLWDRDGRRQATWENEKGITWSPDGRLLVSRSLDGAARLWQADWSLVATLRGHAWPVSWVAWAPDGRTLATSDWETVRLWTDAGVLKQALSGGLRLSGGLERILGNRQAPLRGLAWSPKGNLLATCTYGSYDRGILHTVRLFRADGQLVTELQGHTGSVEQVAWSPDGLTLASGSSKGEIRFWTREGRLQRILDGHPRTKEWDGMILDMGWSPDGLFLASASTDRTIRLWSADGQQQAVLLGHKEMVTKLAWSPRGRLLASCSEDNTIRLWRPEA